MSCQWRDKVALYVDDELDAPVQQQFAAHLSACTECPAAVREQMESMSLSVKSMFNVVLGRAAKRLAQLAPGVVITHIFRRQFPEGDWR